MAKGHGRGLTAGCWGVGALFSKASWGRSLGRGKARCPQGRPVSVASLTCWPTVHPGRWSRCCPPASGLVPYSTALPSILLGDP